MYLLVLLLVGVDGLEMQESLWSADLTERMDDSCLRLDVLVFPQTRRLANSPLRS